MQVVRRLLCGLVVLTGVSFSVLVSSEKVYGVFRRCKGLRFDIRPLKLQFIRPKVKLWS